MDVPHKNREYIKHPRVNNTNGPVHNRSQSGEYDHEYEYRRGQSALITTSDCLLSLDLPIPLQVAQAYRNSLS